MEDEVPGQIPLFTVEDARQELAGQLTALREANVAKVLELRGMGRSMNPGNVALVRLETLIDLLLDEDARLQLDVTFETRMGDVLDASLSSVRRSQLATNDVPGTNGGLIIG